DGDAMQHASGGMPGWPSASAIAASARSLRITPRQFEILMLRARGFSHKTVGQMLNISEATVKAHASAMYRRLDVSTRQEAVKMATERGIHFLSPPNSSDENTRRGQAPPACQAAASIAATGQPAACASCETYRCASNS